MLVVQSLFSIFCLLMLFNYECDQRHITYAVDVTIVSHFSITRDDRIPVSFPMVQQASVLVLFHTVAYFLS